MKIFIIDDTPAKHEWLNLVIKKLNEMDKTVESGFGLDATSSTEKVQNSESLYQALLAQDSIYLVDLDLNESVTVREDFENRLKKCGENWAIETVKRFDNLKYNSEYSPLLGLCRKYSYAIRFLLAAKELKRPVMLISGLGSADDIQTIIDCNLASGNIPRVPSASPKDSQPNDQFISSSVKKILTLIGDPLSKLMTLTKLWFSLNIEHGWKSCEEHGLPHNVNWGKFGLDEHEACVRKVFPWLPNNCGWWKNDTVATSFHNCLKDTIGFHAQWMGDCSGRPLPLGGAYLIFLYALAHQFPNQLEKFVVKDWGVFVLPDNYAKPISFLPPQEKSDAERSVRALYDFFSAILPMQLDSKTLGIMSIIPPNNTSSFQLKLDWNKAQQDECTATMRSLVEDGFSNSKLELPKGKTIGCFLRFLISSQVLKSGIGINGLMILDNKGLLTVGK